MSYVRCTACGYVVYQRRDGSISQHSYMFKLTRQECAAGSPFPGNQVTPPNAERQRRTQIMKSLDRAEKAEAERDRLEELLREVIPQLERVTRVKVQRVLDTLKEAR
jgi:hypothetical protein